MAKINLVPVVANSTLTTINENFQKIANELQNEVLYRDNPEGETNTMENLLDMNANRIINLPAPVAMSEPVRLQDIVDFEGGIAPAILVPFTPTGDISSTNVQNAIVEVDEELHAHINNATGAHQASSVSFSPTGDIVATNVQAAVVEVDGELHSHISNGTGAHAASAVSFTPTGTIAATDVQGAVAEVSGDVTVAQNDIVTLQNNFTTLAGSGGSNTIGFIQSGTGAVARTVQNELRDYVSVKQFGAVGDGVTNDAPAFQAALNAHPIVYIPPTANGYLLTSTITIPPGKVLIGDGGNYAKLISTVSGTTPAISITGVYGGTGQLFTELGGFYLQRQSLTKVGYGINLTQLSYVKFNNMIVQGFDIAINATDCINVILDQVSPINNKRGVVATRTSFSYPNAWTLRDCVVNGNSENGITFTKAATLTVIGGSFEGNGVGGSNPVSSRFAIYMNGNPSEGALGLNCSGVYFEGNSGDGDIIIDANDGDSSNHWIHGCTFNRISNVSFTNNNIRVIKTGTGNTHVNVKGCGFRGFNTYVANSARKYVELVTPVNNSYHINLEGSNFYDNTIEWPAIAGTQASTKSNVAAWVRFDGATVTVNQRHNVASVVRNAAGDYTITYSKPLVNAANAYIITTNGAGYFFIYNETTTTASIRTQNPSQVNTDFSAISVAIMGTDLF